MRWQRLGKNGNRESIAPEAMGNDLREIFEKVERQDELRKRILEPFPEYAYITGLNAYVRHLAVGTRNLSAAVTALMGVTSTEAAVKAHQDVTFFLFALLSAHVSLRDYLYEKSKTLSGMREFHDLVDAWKAAPVSQLILHLRNRVQHGAMLPGSLIIETRSENHPAGIGTIVLFDVGDEFGRGPSRGENENGAFFRLGNHQPVDLAGDYRRNTPWPTVSRS
jgi:hypothetical protein